MMRSPRIFAIERCSVRLQNFDETILGLFQQNLPEADIELRRTLIAFKGRRSAK
jgi:hypothetical protein